MGGLHTIFLYVLGELDQKKYGTFANPGKHLSCIKLL
jgi:hypothetical protein